MPRSNLTIAHFAYAFLLVSAATESAAVAPVPDPAFGLNGTVRAGDAGLPAITPTSVIGLFDGHVVVAGTSPLNAGSQTTILRYTATGLPDPSFNTAGRTTLPEVNYCLQSQRAVRQADETIAVITAASTDPLCMTNVVSGAAILPDGTRDIAYRIAGLPQAIVPRPLSLAQDNAANVYLVGVGEDAQQGYTYLTRLTPRGALDPAFGLLTLEGGAGGVDRAGGVAPLSDGSLLTASLSGTLLYLLHSDAPGARTPVVNGCEGTRSPQDRSLDCSAFGFSGEGVQPPRIHVEHGG